MSPEPTIDQKAVQAYLDYSNGVLKKAKRALADFDDFKHTYFDGKMEFDAFMDQMAEKIAQDEGDQAMVRMLERHLDYCIEQEKAQTESNNNSVATNPRKSSNNPSTEIKTTRRLNLGSKRLI